MFPALLAMLGVAALVLATGGLRPTTSQPRMVRIGFLSPSWPGQEGQVYPLFRPALQELGYSEGTNAEILARFSEGKDALLPQLAAELVRENVDVLVALQPVGTLAAMRATKTIPIVFISISDPVRIGVAQSLRRPGGNVTGVANTPADLNKKRLEILKDALPSLQRVAILARAGNPNSQAQLADIATAANALGLQATLYNAVGVEEFEETFARMSKEGMQALLVVQDGVFFFSRRRIAELALRHRLPAIGDGRVYATDGLFMSYGIAHYGTLVTAAAHRVDMILKGMPPGEIPVDQPIDIGLAVNLTTARKLGIAVQRSLLARAYEIIE